MALAVTNVTEEARIEGPAPAGLSIIVADVTGDASYPTGGYTGLAAGLGISAGRSVVAAHASDSKGFHLDYVAATGKLMFRQQPAAAAAGASPEVPNATSLAAVTARIVAFVV